MDAAHLDGGGAEEGGGGEKVRKHPMWGSTGTLHPTEVFFLFVFFQGEGGRKVTNFHQVDVFQHKKPRLANRGKNYRTCNRPSDTWKTVQKRMTGGTVRQTEHHLVTSAGNGEQIYG